MGICESDYSEKNIISHKKHLQPFHAPIRSQENLNNNNFSLNALSQNDIVSFKYSKPKNQVQLYKYKGTYGKKEEQTTLLTESLYNSFTHNQRNNSRDVTNAEETLNESSSQVFEIITDGKMDKDMIKQSTDKTTIDNYIEYVDDKETELKNSKIDISNAYQNKKRKNK